MRPLHQGTRENCVRIRPKGNWERGKEGLRPYTSQCLDLPTNLDRITLVSVTRAAMPVEDEIIWAMRIEDGKIGVVVYCC